MNLRQKNIILTLVTVAFTDLSAASYAGLDLSGSVNTVKGGVTSELREKNGGVSLKYGYGHDGGRKYQVRGTYVHYNEPLFDETNRDLYELGFDFIQEFDAQHDISPYVKVGLGGGLMPIDNISKSKIYALSLNAGCGISFRLPEGLYLVTGFEYLGRKWQDITYTTVKENTLSTLSYGLGLYVGVNYGF